MKLTLDIDGKAALPVRAIPYASGDPDGLIHPGMVPQILAGSAGDPKDPDEIPRAFRVSLGGIDRAEPGFWSLYRDNVRKLAEQRKTSGLGSVEYFRSCLQLLPADLFVWFDEFNEWQGRTLALVPYNPTYYPREKRIDGWSRWDDPVAVHRPQLCAEAFVPIEFEKLVTEGLESFARGRLANVEAERTDNLAPRTKEETSLPLFDEREPEQGNSPVSAIDGSGRSRHDDIQIEVDDVVAQIKAIGERATASMVMVALKARAGRRDSCITQAAPDGVIWTRGSSGKTEKLTMEALKQRIRRAAKGTLRVR